MQSPDHAPCRAGQAVLSEPGRVDARRAHYLGVEGPAEEAALVHVWRRLEQQRAGDARDRTDVHGVSLPARSRRDLMLVADPVGQTATGT
jgi:hypothetical protein